MKEPQRQGARVCLENPQWMQVEDSKCSVESRSWEDRAQRNSEVLSTLRRTAPTDTDLGMSSTVGLADRSPSTAMINTDKGLKGENGPKE